MHLYQMINPVTHALTPEDVATYKVEPYVVAADVYTAEGHLGRGGWTWYTGSASWLYRVGLEAILGFNKRGESLEMDPCIPETWKEFTIDVPARPTARTRLPCETRTARRKVSRRSLSTARRSPERFLLPVTAALTRSL